MMSHARSVWGFNTDSAKRKSVFLGKRIFRFASADFPRGGGVWGGMRAGFGLGGFGKKSATEFVLDNLIVANFFIYTKKR